MSLTEKSAFLKGLVQGMSLSADKPSEKLLLSIVELLGDLSEKVLGIDEDLNTLYDEFDEYRDMLDCLDNSDNDDDLFEVTCPKCGEILYFEYVDFANGEAICPECGEELNINILDDDEVENCDCDQATLPNDE